MARLLRVMIVSAPAVSSLVVTWLAAPHLYRPSGLFGIALWVMQLGGLGFAAAVGVERVSRRLMPLVNLLGMSLVFPDQAPSRFGVALRSGTTRQLENEVENLRQHGISVDAAEAAEQLLVLVSALGKHERLTRGHTERVRAYSELIGQELKLSAEDQNLLRWGALIHDVGKLAVPAPILSKEERLEDGEWDTIKLHPEVGAALVQPLEDWLGEWRLAASEHHERWDGAGYPLGLAGTEISLAGRIVAVADTYDVITSTRSYKEASSADEARKELVRCAGSQFDPDVVRAFLAVSVGRLHPIAGRFAWIANLGLLFQQAPAAIQTAVVGGTAAAALAGGLVTGAIDVPSLPDGPGIAAERTVDGPGFVFPSIPSEAGTDGGSDDGGGSPIGDSSPSSSVSATTTSSPGSSPPSASILPSPSTVVDSSTVPPTSTSVPTTTTTAPPPTTTTTAPATDCERAQAGETELSGASLVSCDLSGYDLAGASLDEADLTGADLDGADLTSAVVADANLTGASLVGAVLDDARLGGSDAVGADFTDASMVFVRIGGVDLTNANMTRADLTWAAGGPHNTGLAIWQDTTCPNGVVQSTDCYGW